EQVHRAAGADAEHDAVSDVRQRRVGGELLVCVLTQNTCSEKESARNEAGTTLGYEPINGSDKALTDLCFLPSRLALLLAGFLAALLTTLLLRLALAGLLLRGRL